MTNDKEPLESTQVASQQHRPGMYPPSLTSKPTNGKSDSMEPDGGSLSAPASYYQSVTTKGKLILPTAFWVLIILAGVCFLSLFTTLNKTLGTLNVLVELEQEQANSKLDSSKSAAWDHQDHHHNHKHEKIVQDPMAVPLRTAGGSSSPGNSNDGETTPWSPSFAFPSWTSLEPSRKRHLGKAHEPGTQQHGEEKSADGEIKPFLDNMMRADNSDGLLGGGMIVASSSVHSPDETDGSGIQYSLPPSPGLDSILGPLSIFSQIISEQLASTARPHKASRDLPGNFDFEKVNNNKAKSKPDDDSDDIGSGPLITANIGRLNINLNTPNDDDERPTSKQIEKGEHLRRPMMGLVEDSPPEFGLFSTNQIPSRPPHPPPSPSDSETKNLEILMNLLLSPPGQQVDPLNSAIELSPDGSLLLSFDTPFEPERRSIRPPPSAHKHDHHHYGQGHPRAASRSRGQDHEPVSIESAGPEMLMPTEIFPSSVFGLPSGASSDPPLFIALEIDSREPDGSSGIRPSLPSLGDEPPRPMGPNSPYELLSTPDLFTGPEVSVRPGGRPKPHAHKSDMDEVDTTGASGKVDDKSSKKLEVKSLLDAISPVMFGPDFIEPNEMPGRIHIISDDGPQPGKRDEEQKSIFTDIVSKENTGAANKEPKGPPPMPDLFNLMFGPPPSSKLTVKPLGDVREPESVVLAQTTRKPSGEIEQAGEKGNLFIEPLGVSSPGPQPADDHPSTTSPSTSTLSDGATFSHLMDEKKKNSQPDSILTKEESEQLQRFADGFMNILSLPQLAKEQAPKKVDVLETAAQQSGSGASGSSDTHTVSADLTSPLATTLSSLTSSNIRDSVEAKKSNLSEDLKHLTGSLGSTQSMQPVTPTIVTPMASMQVNKVTEPSIDQGNLKTTTASHMVPINIQVTTTSRTTPKPEVTETNPPTSEPEKFSTPPTFTTGSPVAEQETTITTHHAITAPSLTTSGDSSQSQSTIEVDKTTMAPRVHEESGVTSTTTKKPSKSFLQKADDFIGRNIFDFRRFLH